MTAPTLREPHWCVRGPDCGGDHLTAFLKIPATANHDDDEVTVYANHAESDGYDLCVTLAVDERVEVDLTLGEARELAASLHLLLGQVEPDQVSVAKGGHR